MLRLKFPRARLQAQSPWWVLPQYLAGNVAVVWPWGVRLSKLRRRLCVSRAMLPYRLRQGAAVRLLLHVRLLLWHLAELGGKDAQREQC